MCLPIEEMGQSMLRIASAPEDQSSSVSAELGSGISAFLNLRVNSSGQGRLVWSASVANNISAPAAYVEDNGNSNRWQINGGISLFCPAASKAGCHHHSGEGERSFSGTARHCSSVLDFLTAQRVAPSVKSAVFPLNSTVRSDDSRLFVSCGVFTAPCHYSIDPLVMENGRLRWIKISHRPQACGGSGIASIFSSSRRF
jgi:hypothetical protein